MGAPNKVKEAAPVKIRRTVRLSPACYDGRLRTVDSVLPPAHLLAPPLWIASWLGAATDTVV